MPRMNRWRTPRPDHPALRELDHLYSLARRLVGGRRIEAEKLVLEGVRDTAGDDRVPSLRELELAIVRAFARLRTPRDAPGSRQLDPDLLDRLPPDVVRTALDGLPAEIRTPLVLAIHSGLDRQSAAEALGLTPAEMFELGSRGRHELHQRLVACAKLIEAIERGEE